MIKNVIYNWAGLIVAGAISFLLTPFMIHSLGAFYYGLWMLVGSVTDYYGLLDAGIRVTLQRYVARQHAQQEREALNETFTTAFVLTLAVFAGVMVLAVGLMFVLPKFFALDPASRDIFR